jgi:hypothetical protein
LDNRSDFGGCPIRAGNQLRGFTKFVTEHKTAYADPAMDARIVVEKPSSTCPEEIPSAMRVFLSCATRVASCQARFYYLSAPRRSGRAVEGGGLENRCGASHRGFKSLLLRQTMPLY